MSPKLCLKLAFLLVLCSVIPVLTSAQVANVQSRIGQAIDEKNLVTLQGNTHPMAQAQFDRGEAPASLPMNRMLLVLQHTPEQETSLKQLIADQQNQSSPRFHQWLTSEQYGQSFGPSAEDIKAVTSWLQSHGFDVARVSTGGHVVEFSGTAGQVQAAFHTSIHHYSVNGEDHWANSTDPQIPAALAPVVKGVKSLHNFHAKANANYAGLFQRDKSTGQTKQISGPNFTFTSNDNTFFGLGPADFATIYNVKPLWDAGVDGTGETIAIVQEPTSTFRTSEISAPCSGCRQTILKSSWTARIQELFRMSNRKR
jgi:subtilase family serine protease